MLSLLSALCLLFQAVISVRTELVTVPVVVTDRHGHRITGLRQEDFHVFEEGRPQPVAIFHHGDAPITIGLVVDRSQSMRAKTASLLSAVSAVLRTARPDDELFAITFNDSVSFTLPAEHAFTRDATALSAALAATRSEGRTALYDGIAAGLRQLDRGRPDGARALVVVSDGGDNASRQRYSEIVATARQSNVVIYAIGLQSASDAQGEEDAGLLARLCRDTGGVAAFPTGEKGIAAASNDVARDLREQYTLGFTPGARTDGQAFRKIEVRVTRSGSAGYRIRARSGYIAGDGMGRKETP